MTSEELEVVEIKNLMDKKFYEAYRQYIIPTKVQDEHVTNCYLWNVHNWRLNKYRFIQRSRSCYVTAHRNTYKRCADANKAWVEKGRFNVIAFPALEKKDSVHHDCYVKPCCRPSHLVAIPHSANIRYFVL